jgi:hypothetical protein
MTNPVLDIPFNYPLPHQRDNLNITKIIVSEIPPCGHVKCLTFRTPNHLCLRAAAAVGPNDPGILPSVPIVHLEAKIARHGALLFSIVQPDLKFDSNISPSAARD